MTSTFVSKKRATTSVEFRATGFAHTEQRLNLRQYGRFRPFHPNPRRVAHDQIKAAALSRRPQYFGEDQFPMMEVLFCGQLTRHSEPWHSIGNGLRVGNPGIS